MKYPASHYPNSGIQHTRAVFALSMVTMFHGMYQPKPETDIESHMKKIRLKVNECAELTQKKKLSQGAKRALDAATEALSPYLEVGHLAKAKAYERWCAFVWCALTFIEDVLNTCPQYMIGSYAKKWKELHCLVETLTNSLYDIAPKHDEEGTMFYEMAAWAMEGVDFPVDDRLVA